MPAMGKDVAWAVEATVEMRWRDFIFMTELFMKEPAAEVTQAMGKDPARQRGNDCKRTQGSASIVRSADCSTGAVRQDVMVQKEQKMPGGGFSAARWACARIFIFTIIPSLSFPYHSGLNLK